MDSMITEILVLVVLITVLLVPIETTVLLVLTSEKMPQNVVAHLVIMILVKLFVIYVELNVLLVITIMFVSLVKTLV
jgi:hypothetical protein